MKSGQLKQILLTARIFSFASEPRHIHQGSFRIKGIGHFSLLGKNIKSGSSGSIAFQIQFLFKECFPQPVVFFLRANLAAFRFK